MKKGTQTKGKKIHSVQSSLCQWVEKWMDKNIFCVVIHHLRSGCSRAARRIPPSFLPSFKHWKWAQFEQHLLCGILESAGSNNGPLEQGPFLLLIAATCVVGKSPFACTTSPGSRPESPTQSLSEHSQQQTHSNCKEWSPWLESRGGAPGPCVLAEGQLVLLHSRTGLKCLQAMQKWPNGDTRHCGCNIFWLNLRALG